MINPCEPLLGEVTNESSHNFEVFKKLCGAHDVQSCEAIHHEGMRPAEKLELILDTFYGMITKLIDVGPAEEDHDNDVIELVDGLKLLYTNDNKKELGTLKKMAKPRLDKIYDATRQEEFNEQCEDYRAL